MGKWEFVMTRGSSEIYSNNDGNAFSSELNRYNIPQNSFNCQRHKCDAAQTHITFPWP